MQSISSEPSGDVRPPRLRDLIGVGRLLLYGLGFWTSVALVFAAQHALLLARAGVAQPLYQVVMSELASWWPCVLLTPPTVAATLQIRARQVSRLGRIGSPRGRRGFSSSRSQEPPWAFSRLYCRGDDRTADGSARRRGEWRATSVPTFCSISSLLPPPCLRRTPGNRDGGRSPRRTTLASWPRPGCTC